jgi:hypothetical protein
MNIVFFAFVVAPQFKALQRAVRDQGPRVRQRGLRADAVRALCCSSH